jgi:para-nitrobenzyl esterase
MSNFTVSCNAGSFKGLFQNNVHTFYGIPFARPLTQETKWQAPEVLATEITFDAITPGHSAPQTIYKKSFFSDPDLPGESIDCLSLNIGSTDLNGHMPVMIWIHGGAYVTGSANSAIYDLNSMPLHGVVLVTINYRLGPFGFLKLDDVTNGVISSTGNEGLMDQRMAIEWVRDNIHAFGGDPDNITLFGESAGAWSVALQSSANPAGNIFSKAICQSGGMDAYVEKDRANLWGELFLKTCHEEGLAINDLCMVPHQVITGISKKMRHTMIADGAWLTPEIGFAPVADGIFLPLEPLKNFKDSQIKLLVGSTADEYKLWSELEPYFLTLTKVKLDKRLKKLFSQKSISNIKAQYLDKSLGEHSYKNTLSNIMTDWTFGVHILNLLEMNPSTTFGYQFNMKSPLLEGRLGAYHGSELPYLFGSWIKFPDLCSSEAKFVSDFLQASWTNFAKTGSPSSDQFFWPSYLKENSVAQINSMIELKPYNNVSNIKLLHDSKITY